MSPITSAQPHPIPSYTSNNQIVANIAILPFNLIEATFLAPYEAESYSTADLITN
ncbi:hypothetical protein PISMIDRAFT_17874 [Pisolithus microcarpus 441]|uniref:Uncharacterized protein n=1 Tax=Pisolithus microcarpus 441 TaxID=765257 RepID=A0A0C9Z0U8_9AGAM|nr:hypothetical protein PISMIDRAFT_17874 [Pisolithus microcarpus 441]